MSWKDLLRSLRETSQDALETAKDKLLSAAAGAPIPGLRSGAQEPEEEAPEAGEPPRRLMRPLDDRSRERDPRGPIYDLDAQLREALEAADSVSPPSPPPACGADPSSPAPASALAPSPPPAPPPPIPPPGAPATAPMAAPASAPPRIPGMEVRRHGEPAKPAAFGIVASDANDTAYLHRTSKVDFVQRNYGPFGAAVSAAALAYALQPGGVQRMVARLGLRPWNNEVMDHEEALKFLQTQGVEAFARALGVRLPPGDEDAAPDKCRTTAPAEAERPPAREEPPSPGSRARQAAPSAADPASPRPAAAATPRRAASTAGSSHKIRVEGAQFQPVRIKKDSPVVPAVSAAPASSAASAAPPAGKTAAPGVPPITRRETPFQDAYPTPPEDELDRADAPPSPPPAAQSQAPAPPRLVLRARPPRSDAETREQAPRPATPFPASRAATPAAQAPATPGARRFLDAFLGEDTSEGE